MDVRPSQQDVLSLILSRSFPETRTLTKTECNTQTPALQLFFNIDDILSPLCMFACLFTSLAVSFPYLSPWMPHPPAFFSLSECVWERNGQRRLNPTSLLVVCYLQLIRLESDFSSGPWQKVRQDETQGYEQQWRPSRVYDRRTKIRPRSELSV